MTKLQFKPRAYQQRMLDAMALRNVGIVKCPTGGGKTFTFITDARRHLKAGRAILVVAPQLMLGKQLFTEFDKHLGDIDFMALPVSSTNDPYHRANGFARSKTEKSLLTSTTSPAGVVEAYRLAQKRRKPLIVFTTYKSLSRVVESAVPFKAAYFDEAHHATETDAFVAVRELVGGQTERAYYFTATPKLADSKDGRGMDNVSVFGDVIAQVNFMEPVEAGAIVLPKIHVMKSDLVASDNDQGRVNFTSIVETVRHYEKEFTDTPNHKILFCMDGTKSIGEVMDEGLVEWARTRGYKVLSIDSVNEGYIDGQSGIAKDKFIKRLNELGDDPNEKLIVLHVKMLGEGIDVKAFTGVAFLRNSLGSIEAVQAIGRVLRAAPGKKRGVVTIVEHEDRGEFVRQMIEEVVASLIQAGVPPAVLLPEESDGRGKEDEIVEDLHLFDGQRLLKEQIAVWEHRLSLEQVLSKSLDDLFV